MSSLLEDYLAFQFAANGLTGYVREYKAIPCRKFRWDFAFVEAQLLIEVQGGIYTKSAHSTGQGLERDYTKNNLANLYGWRVLQFSRSMIEDGTAVELIKACLQESEEN
jgi:very-short-patch-repair endonuclease